MDGRDLATGRRFIVQMPIKNRPRGRRSQAEAARTRDRLLDRAERLFARKGYRGVSVRELARAAGVHNFTIQVHFGSKLGLYRAVLSRWDGEIRSRVARALDQAHDLPEFMDLIIDRLFDFLLEKRDWVAINARAALGEGGVDERRLDDRKWLRFMRETMSSRAMRLDGFDLRLLLITLEGILANHVLAEAHYRELFGRDVTDADLRASTKVHVRTVILMLVTEDQGELEKRPSAERRTRRLRSD